MTDKNQTSWKNILDPDVLRPNLIAVSLYIAAFEILKTTIIEKLRDFYCFGWNENGAVIDPKYAKEVLSRNSSPVYASLDWLKEMKAINDDDIAAFNNLKECRNKFAHALTHMLMDGLSADFPERFAELIALVEKIGRWWVINVDMATDPEYSDREVKEEDVIPGQIVGLRLMMDVALGSKEESRRYIDEFVRRKLVPAN